MPTKAQIKLIRSLHLKKFRNEYNLFVAEGSTNVLDLLNSPFRLQWLFARETWIEKFGERLQEVNVQQVSRKEMEMMSSLKSSSEVLAVFKLPELSDFSSDAIDDYVIALDNIKDPGNLGTIIRTADWFGIKSIICSLETVDVYNPKVVQATMGSLARVQVHYLDLEKVLSEVPTDIDVYGAFLHGDPVSHVEKQGKGIILIGSEAHGISKEYLSLTTHKVTIPSFAKGKPGAESLNAVVATAILCYEFRR
jgi:TrmH family RNA methyltransferase